MIANRSAKDTMLVAFGILAMIAAGCDRPTNALRESQAVSSSTADQTATPKTSMPVASSEAKKTDEEHGHVPGSHGGIVVPIGSDSYHAEAVIESNGSFRLLTLGKDESRIQEVDIQPIKAYVKASGAPDTTPIDLTATPQDGDSNGKTSQFVGQLPVSLVGKPLDVTIPNLRINGERFRVGFTTASASHETASHDSGMPSGVAPDGERKLYLTPGGKYTEADIKANGNVTASQKFKGVVSSHDMFPKAGDKICPITMTKANPKFTWVIDGKSYQFCCPPCVDEYVRMAKEEPEKLRDPGEFFK